MGLFDGLHAILAVITLLGKLLKAKFMFSLHKSIKGEDEVILNDLLESYQCKDNSTPNPSIHPV